MAGDFDRMRRRDAAVLSWFGEGDGDRHKLGGKGAALDEMARLGLPVPPGFTIRTEACRAFQDSPRATLWKLRSVITPAYKELSRRVGRPPLVSVRSGAPVSMPGMMDTVLNVGLTSKTLLRWKRALGMRAAADCQRRLQQMYGTVVLGLPADEFEAVLAAAREVHGAEQDSDLPVKALCEMVGRFAQIYEEHEGMLPDTVEAQLMGAVVAVLKSWNNPRAVEYREMHGIPDTGTAVNIQAMVFGNADERSGSGVLFTRDPSTGERSIVGEFLQGAQGEDVVSGTRNPLPLSAMDSLGLEDARKRLHEIAEQLEAVRDEMQDIEFTVERGRLYVLQTRAGKRSARAAFKIATDFVDEGRITRGQALARLSPRDWASAHRRRVDPAFTLEPRLTGIAASPGVATGRVVGTSSEAVEAAKHGESVVLVRSDTSPDDLPGMRAAVAVLTERGGLTSHAAVVARALDTPCVVGANWATMLCHPPGVRVSVCGDTGRVWTGDVPLVGGGEDESLAKALEWAYESLGATWAGPHLEHSRQRVLCAGWDDGYSPSEVLAALNEPSGVVFDLRGELLYQRLDDLGLYGLFGTGDGDRVARGALRRLEEMEGRGAVVYLPSRHGVDTKKLRERGYRLALEVETVADLLACDGAVDVSSDVVSSVFGGQEAFEGLLKVLAAEGRDLASVPRGLWPSEVVRQAFTREES